MEVIGERIKLRKMQRDDIPNRVKWFNDPDVNKTLLLEGNFNLEKTHEWFDGAIEDDSRIDFVVENQQGESIGFTSLVNIDRREATAECFCIIGDKKSWGKGLGTEIHRVLIDWGFKNLGINKVWADIRAENIAIIKVIEKLGFKEEARGEKLVKEEKVDVIRVGVLKDEFYKIHPELLDTKQ